MADVLIKDLEMSKAGGWKIICIYPDGTCEASNWQNDCTFLPCVAIPLPKGHGKLVDVNELKKLTYEIKTNRGTYQRVINIVDLLNAPAIIEAEGSV